MIKADVPATVMLDGESLGHFSPSDVRTVQIEPGKHLVSATSDEGSIPWDQVIEVRPGSRDVILVRLRDEVEKRRREGLKTSGPTTAAPPSVTPNDRATTALDRLRRLAGVWDAVVVMKVGGGTPVTSSAVETLTFDGESLVADYKSDFMGKPFHGRGVTRYDAVLGKYVGSWTDTMSSAPSTSEAAYDPVTNTETGWLEGPDDKGALIRMKAVTQYFGDDTRVFFLYQPDSSGREQEVLRTTYTRCR